MKNLLLKIVPMIKPDSGAGIMKKVFFGFFVAFIGFLGFAYNQENEVPPAHLLAARELLSTIQPENNSYRHRPSTVFWKGSAGAPYSVCHTDCSGLIDALLSHSYGYTTHDFEKWLRKKRALSSSYFRAISEEHGFKRIMRIQDVLPGDLLSYKLPPGSRNFGHVMLVNGRPLPLQSDRPPTVPGTLQWAVPIIDCTGKGHGENDSRYLGQGRFQSGIGSGELRIYTNADGLIVGCAWSPSPTAKFYDSQSRPFVAGRLIPGFHP